MKKILPLIISCLVFSSCMLQKSQETIPKTPTPTPNISSEVIKSENSINIQPTPKPVEKPKVENTKVTTSIKAEATAEDMTKELDNMIDAIVSGK